MNLLFQNVLLSVYCFKMFYCPFTVSKSFTVHLLFLSSFLFSSDLGGSAAGEDASGKKTSVGHNGASPSGGAFIFLWILETTCVIINETNHPSRIILAGYSARENLNRKTSVDDFDRNSGNLWWT